MSVTVFGILCLLVAVLGSWTVGRLTVPVMTVRGIAPRILLFVALSLLGIVVSLGPAVAFVFLIEELASTLHEGHRVPLALQVGALMYIAVLYVSFRLGLEKVGGTG